MSSSMNKEQIKEIIPHREPMLLIETVELTEDGHAVGTYTVQGDEFFLQGHFPGNPVVPGVILCEMMAQTCCVLFADQMKDGGATPLFTSLDKVKFKNIVKPGDTIRFECEITRARGVFYFAKGSGYVGDTLSVSGEFSFALVASEPKSSAGNKTTSAGEGA